MLGSPRRSWLHPRLRGATLLLSLALASVANPAAGSESGGAPDQRIALHAARLVDGRSDLARLDAWVLVEGERIAAVGGREVAPDGIPVVELGDATLLPGLVDVHSHPLIDSDDYQFDHLRRSSAAKALRGLRAVQENLWAGWTTLRIAGDADVFYAHLDVRRAIDEGLFLGPRLSGAGHYLSVTGGGGDINTVGPEQHLVADGLVVDGVDEILKAVRRELKFGSDWIKLLVTGAFMSTGDQPTDVHFSPAELAAVVEEAGRRHVPVMAHAHATEGIKMAVRAGVRSIEHGTFLDDEAIELMLRHGTYLVPTIYVGDWYLEQGSAAAQMDKMLELTRRYQAEFEAWVGRAARRGVKIAVGSDFGANPEHNAGEIAALVRVGMTPMQALQAATRVGAELLGWEARIGTVEPGKLADLVAVSGDPLVDIQQMRQVRFVMIGGAVVRDDTRDGPPPRFGALPRP